MSSSRENKPSSSPQPIPKRKSTLVVIIISITIAVALSSTAILYFNNYIINGTSLSFYVVGSGSMVPTFNIDDLLIVQKVGNLTSAQATQFNSIKVGDPILFKNPAFINSKGKLPTIVHRVVQIYQDEKGQRILKTKGDANPVSIPGLDYPLYQKYYIGKVVYDIPKLGLVGKALAPPSNYIIMAALAFIFIIVYKVKYNQRRRSTASSSPSSK